MPHKLSELCQLPGQVRPGPSDQSPASLRQIQCHARARTREDFQGRNVPCCALGNLHGFEPARDTVSVAEMLEIDRWALAELDLVIDRVLKAYEAYEFHTVYHTLYNFATVTLSARYFDIVKDRLYTYAPRNHARRSAQTALFRIADALARMLAPILVFTADEIWENLSNTPEVLSFVHL